MTSVKPNRANQDDETLAIDDETLANDAYVASRPKSLMPLKLVQGEEATVAHLQQLIAEGESDRRLLVLVANCESQRELFQALVTARRRSDTWAEFVTVLLTLPEKTWDGRGGPLDEDLIHLISTPHCLLYPKTEVAKAIRKAITTPDHPLFQSYSFESYWTDHVRHCIGNRDFRRALEAVKRAHRGLPLAERDAPEGPDDFDLRASSVDPKYRCCSIEVTAIRQLIEELFSAMVAHQKLKELSASASLPEECNIDRPSFAFAKSLGGVHAIKAYRIALYLYRAKQRAARKQK
jgi:hypothetical protein